MTFDAQDQNMTTTVALGTISPDLAQLATVEIVQASHEDYIFIEIIDDAVIASIMPELIDGDDFFLTEIRVSGYTDDGDEIGQNYPIKIEVIDSKEVECLDDCGSDGSDKGTESNSTANNETETSKDETGTTSVV